MQQLPIPSFQRQVIITGRQEVVARRETMLLLPDSVSYRLKWIGTVNSGKGSKPYLPSGLQPMTEAEISAAKSQAGDIEILVAPSNSVDEEKEKLAALTKMFLAKPSAGITDLGAASRAESYMMALDDIPSWAILDAIKKWHRGDVKGVSEEDLRWAPDTAVLRRIALDQMKPYLERAHELKLVIESKPLDEVLK